MNLTRPAFLATLASIALGLFGNVHAADWPTKPIRIVIPYPAGGTTDQQVRLLQEPLQRLLGQPIIVDNKPGAAGALATVLVAKSPADGYTMLFPNNALVITPYLSRDAGYNALRDFAPVSLVSTAPMVMVAHPSLPASDVKGLLDYAKANPGQVTYASAGVGAFGHLATEMLSHKAGVKMLHIPYKGQAPSSLAVMTGEVKLLMTTSSAAMTNNVKEGKLRLLGVASSQATPLVPGAVPIANTLPGFSADVWFGLFAPAGTPPEAINTFRDALAKVLAQNDIKEKYAAFGALATSSTPAQLGERIAKESAEWGVVLKDTAIKLE